MNLKYVIDNLPIIVSYSYKREYDMEKHKLLTAIKEEKSVSIFGNEVEGMFSFLVDILKDREIPDEKNIRYFLTQYNFSIFTYISKFDKKVEVCRKALPQVNSDILETLKSNGVSITSEAYFSLIFSQNKNLCEKYGVSDDLSGIEDVESYTENIIRKIKQGKEHSDKYNELSENKNYLQELKAYYKELDAYTQYSFFTPDTFVHSFLKDKEKKDNFLFKFENFFYSRYTGVIHSVYKYANKKNDVVELYKRTYNQDTYLLDEKFVDFVFSNLVFAECRFDPRFIYPAIGERSFKLIQKCVKDRFGDVNIPEYFYSTLYKAFIYQINMPIMKFLKIRRGKGKDVESINRKIKKIIREIFEDFSTFRLNNVDFSLHLIDTALSLREFVSSEIEIRDNIKLENEDIETAAEIMISPSIFSLPELYKGCDIPEQASRVDRELFCKCIQAIENNFSKI